MFEYNPNFSFSELTDQKSHILNKLSFLVLDYDSGSYFLNDRDFLLDFEDSQYFGFNEYTRPKSY